MLKNLGTACGQRIFAAALLMFCVLVLQGCDQGAGEQNLSQDQNLQNDQTGQDAGEQNVAQDQNRQNEQIGQGQSGTEQTGKNQGPGRSSPSGSRPDTSGSNPATGSSGGEPNPGQNGPSESMPGQAGAGEAEARPDQPSAGNGNRSTPGSNRGPGTRPGQPSAGQSGPGARPGPGGNGAGAPASSSAHAAPVLGDVAKTIVAGTDARTGANFQAGENIYGPFEAGFGSQQDGILESLGCAQGSLGHVAGGIDTQLAEQMIAQQCSITLPRIEGGGSDGYISLLDECGGHTREYHFHEKLSCLYDGASGAHSPQVAEALDGKPLYGKWEHAEQKVLPMLDACGGHYGKTPQSPAADVYHYHTQDSAPFTVGCFGPNEDGSMVTVQQCRNFYAGCDGNLVTVNTPQGTKEYDDWCPCFDSKGSNTGKDIAQLPVFSATNISQVAAQSQQQTHLRGSASTSSTASQR